MGSAGVTPSGRLPGGLRGMHARRSVLTLAVALACAPAAHAAAPYDRLAREDFNRLAVRANLSLFWIADADADGAVDPEEVTQLLFYPAAPAWTDGAGFTSAFDDAYEQLVAAKSAPVEGHRRALVARDLDAGVPTLIRNDLRGLPAADTAFVRHMQTVAARIDRLFDRTTGAAAVAGRVPADALDQSLFRRNRGPACQAPVNDGVKGCSAIPGAPEPRASYYPRALQDHDGFCQRLEKRPDAGRLLSPFTVVRRRHGALKAVPYTTAYRRPMRAIAGELEAAAASVADPAEDALRRYLRAAARSFRTNHWGPADEAWVSMNAQNSKWYVRVAPDEVSSDPCEHKAGFHLTFARINTRSLRYQRELAPLRQRAETAFAALAGAPYRARRVGFQLPDFVDIVLNAGDDRGALGTTLGQSLPNWGKVAREGRGRTVAMTNVDTDADSAIARRVRVRSLLDTASADAWTDDAEARLLTTILHEASHNLGPAAGYRVRGKTTEQIFGGDLDSTLEELKAESGGLYLIDYFLRNGVIDAATAERAYREQIIYAFEQIPYGKGDSYAELSMIELGFFLDHGALVWRTDATAANGTDRGAYAVHADRLAASSRALLRTVARIKAGGDRKAAIALRKRYVDGTARLQHKITRRINRQPKSSFVYALDLD